MMCWLMGHDFLQVNNDWLICQHCGKKVSVEPIGWRVDYPETTETKTDAGKEQP